MRFHPALFNQALSNTPSGPSVYDETMATLTPVMYTPGPTTSVNWVSGETLTAQDYGSEANWTSWYVDAWFLESSNQDSYETTLAYTVMGKVFQIDDTTTVTVDFETLTDLLSGDLGSEANYGQLYLNYWVAGSPESTTYDNVLGHTDYDVMFQVDDTYTEI